jgi:hypothetical protein
MIDPSQCPHVTLSRQNVGSFHWYLCHVCGQKFKAAEWDGKMVVVAADAGKVISTASPTNCGDEFTVPDGFEVTDYCDPCAQELVPELLEALNQSQRFIDYLCEISTLKLKSVRMMAGYHSIEAAIKLAGSSSRKGK